MIQTGQKTSPGPLTDLVNTSTAPLRAVALQGDPCALPTHLMKLAGTLKVTKLTPLQAKVTAALHTWLAHNSLLSNWVSVSQLHLGPSSLAHDSKMA